MVVKSIYPFIIFIIHDVKYLKEFIMFIVRIFYAIAYFAVLLLEIGKATWDVAIRTVNGKKSNL